MTAKEQARLLGLFFWILTGLQLLFVGGLGLLYVFIFGAIAALPPGKGEPPPVFILPFIIGVVAFIFVMTLLFCIPKLVAAYGLRHEKPWAKIWTIIASVMAAMNPPLGTAVGVFGLVFVFSDAGKAYFDNLAYGGIAPVGLPAAEPQPTNTWNQNKDFKQPEPGQWQ